MVSISLLSSFHEHPIDDDPEEVVFLKRTRPSPSEQQRDQIEELVRQLREFNAVQPNPRWNREICLSCGRQPPIDNGTLCALLKASGHAGLQNQFKRFGIFNDVHLDQFLSLDLSIQGEILDQIAGSPFRRLDLEHVFRLFNTALKYNDLSPLPGRDTMRRLRNPELDISFVAAEMDIDHKVCESLEGPILRIANEMLPKRNATGNHWQAFKRRVCQEYPGFHGYAANWPLVIFLRRRCSAKKDMSLDQGIALHEGPRQGSTRSKSPLITRKKYAAICKASSSKAVIDLSQPSLLSKRLATSYTCASGCPKISTDTIDELPITLQELAVTLGMEQLLPAMVALGINSEKKLTAFAKYGDERLRAKFDKLAHISDFHKILLRFVLKKKAEKV